MINKFSKTADMPPAGPGELLLSPTIENMHQAICHVLDGRFGHIDLCQLQIMESVFEAMLDPKGPVKVMARAGLDRLIVLKVQQGFNPYVLGDGYEGLGIVGNVIEEPKGAGGGPKSTDGPLSASDEVSENG